MQNKEEEARSKAKMKVNVRQVSVFLLVAVVVMQSTGLLFSAMGVPSATFTITSGVYPGAPSYTVWNETGTFYAKNVNGFIEYSGTNASQVITNLLDAIKTVGGDIKLIGQFDLDAPIVLPETPSTETAIKIYGQAAGKWAQLGTRITSSSALSSLVTNDYSNDALASHNFVFEDITFDGKNAVTTLIDLINTDTVSFDRCTFRAWTTYAVSTTWAGATVPIHMADIPGKTFVRDSEFIPSGAATASIYYEWAVENYVTNNIFNDGDLEAQIWIKDSLEIFIQGNEINQLTNVTKTPKALIYIQNTGDDPSVIYCRDIISRGNWLYRTSEGYYDHQIVDTSGNIAYYPSRIVIDDATAPWYHPFNGKISQTSQIRYNGYFGLNDTLSTNASGQVDVTFEGSCQKYPLINVELQGNYGWYISAWYHDADNWHTGAKLQIVNLTDGSPVGASKAVVVHTQYYN